MSSPGSFALSTPCSGIRTLNASSVIATAKTQSLNEASLCNSADLGIRRNNPGYPHRKQIVACSTTHDLPGRMLSRLAPTDVGTLLVLFDLGVDVLICRITSLLVGQDRQTR